MESVDEKLCYVRHEAIRSNQERIDTRLEQCEKRLDFIEDELIKIKSIVESTGKKSIFDKLLIVSLAGMVLLFMILLVGAANVIRFIDLVRG